MLKKSKSTASSTRKAKASSEKSALSSKTKQTAGSKVKAKAKAKAKAKTKSSMKLTAKSNPRSKVPAAVPAITFGPSAVKTAVSLHSLQILQSIMAVANVPSLLITSTQRTAADQARAMYDNIKAFGAKRQYELYGPNGDKVIDVYVKLLGQGKSSEEIKKAMVEKINELGPQKVSRHCADPKVVNVFDVAPSSISRKAQFVAAIQAEKRIDKFLQPPADPAYHIEILQPQN